MDKIIKAVTHDLAEYVKVNNACTKEATAEADAIANGTAPKPEEAAAPAADTGAPDAGAPAAGDGSSGDAGDTGLTNPF
jgi:hypothetical protein